MTCDIYKHMAF